MINIKPYHIGLSCIFILLCFIILLKTSSTTNQLGLRDEDVISGPLQKTIPVHFKRRKDIPNQCFPLNSEVSGCLPSVIVLGPSKGELSHTIDILESHPSLNNGETKAEFHSDPNQKSFYDYFQSFPSQRGRIFIYFDAASSYFHSQAAPLSIRKAAPTTIFLIPLMDPIQHTISQYYSHTAELPKECFDIPLEDYLQQEIDTLKACKIPVKFPSVPWKANPIPKKCQLISTNCDNFNLNSAQKTFSLNTHGAFLSEGLYSYHLNHWFSYFDRKQFHITTIEALEQPSPALWKFLGADPNLWLEEFMAEAEPVMDYKSAVNKNTFKWLKQFFSPSVKTLKKMIPHISFPEYEK